MVPVALGRAIVQQLFPSTNEPFFITPRQRLELLLMQAVDGAGIEPELADTITQQAPNLAA